MRGEGDKGDRGDRGIGVEGVRVVDGKKYIGYRGISVRGMSGKPDI